MKCKEFAGAEIRFTGRLDRVIAPVRFLPEGSRGGWEIEGEYRGARVTVWAWPRNNLGERMMKAFQDYTRACDAESLDAFGPDDWAARGCPQGPLG